MKTFRELLKRESNGLFVRACDVRKALDSEGYDGLYNNDCDCLCVRGDLMPCGEPSPDCVAGVLGPPNSDEWDIGLYPTREAAERAKREMP